MTRWISYLRLLPKSVSSNTANSSYFICQLMGVLSRWPFELCGDFLQRSQRELFNDRDLAIIVSTLWIPFANPSETAGSMHGHIQWITVARRNDSWAAISIDARARACALFVGSFAKPAKSALIASNYLAWCVSVVLYSRPGLVEGRLLGIAPTPLIRRPGARMHDDKGAKFR